MKGGQSSTKRQSVVHEGGAGDEIQLGGLVAVSIT